MARDPFRIVDDEARQLARDLLVAARHGALGVRDPDSGDPVVSRVAVLWVDAALHLLMSDLAPHTAALRAAPRCSVMLDDAVARGDPLTHPRLTLMSRAVPAAKAALRESWLAAQPKARLYYDFADFSVFRLSPHAALLNGGFGRAWRLRPDDLPGAGDPPPGADGGTA